MWTRFVARSTSKHATYKACKQLEYQPGDGMKDWLKRHGVYPGSVGPAKIPYYVLLVGGPSAIPFQFQYLPDIEYAVGRVAFEHADQYRQYAESVVEYESAGAVPNAREIVYWGALLCQDWTGSGAVQPGHYLTAAEIADDARLHGLVAFLFACYGAGTPAFGNFLTERNDAQNYILLGDPAVRIRADQLA